ncbi:MAG: hypothetical protein AABY15_08300 [Nanoarchaeota archaeon]
MDAGFISSKDFYLNHSEAKKRFSLVAGIVKNPQEVFNGQL